MAKLYFKYGAMGSSKTATALITKYNSGSSSPLPTAATAYSRCAAA